MEIKSRKLVPVSVFRWVMRGFLGGMAGFEMEELTQMPTLENVFPHMEELGLRVWIDELIEGGNLEKFALSNGHLTMELNRIGLVLKRNGYCQTFTLQEKEAIRLGFDLYNNPLGLTKLTANELQRHLLEGNSN